MCSRTSKQMIESKVWFVKGMLVREALSSGIWTFSMLISVFAALFDFFDMSRETTERPFL